MPVSVFLNNGTKLKLQTNNGCQDSNGWWNTVVAEDFDNDGDIDIVAGNWGLNTRLTATPSEPITLYRNDFDGNNDVETLVTHFYKGQETTFSSKDELAKQLPIINKKFLSYKEKEYELLKQEILSLKERLNKIYAKHTKKTEIEIKKALERDNFMTPAEAKNFGLIDDVVEKRT